MEETDKVENKNKALVETLQAIIISLVITTVVYIFIAMPNQVISISMMPTFRDGELVITNKVINWLDSTQVGDTLGIHYQKGDVIVFQKPGDADLIKRIIAMEGDKLMLKDGHIILNGELLEEQYLDSSVKTKGASFLPDNEELTIPEDSYFVMGDNRSKSLDSRYLDVGLVHRSHIKGKVIWRYWPLDRFGGIYTGKTAPISYPIQAQ